MGSGNVRVVMWKCVFNNVEMHIWLWEYAFLVMLGYGHDESAPTPTEWTWKNVGYNK